MNNLETENVGKYDALFGRNILPTNPLLSPKLVHILRASKQQQHVHTDSFQKYDDRLLMKQDSTMQSPSLFDVTQLTPGESTK